jgi:hypothetical protein
MMQANCSYNEIRAGTPLRNLDAVRSERLGRSRGI